MIQSGVPGFLPILGKITSYDNHLIVYDGVLLCPESFVFLPHRSGQTHLPLPPQSFQEVLWDRDSTGKGVVTLIDSWDKG